MLLAWQLGDTSELPAAFRPLKRIPQFVLEGIESEPVENKLKVLAMLRKQGYFKELSQHK